VFDDLYFIDLVVIDLIFCYPRFIALLGFFSPSLNLNAVDQSWDYDIAPCMLLPVPSYLLHTFQCYMHGGIMLLFSQTQPTLEYYGK